MITVNKQVRRHTLLILINIYMELFRNYIFGKSFYILNQYLDASCHDILFGRTALLNNEECTVDCKISLLMKFATYHTFIEITDSRQICNN